MGQALCGALHEIAVIAVPPHYTTQKCSGCGTMVKKSLSIRTHICTSCGVVLDRDHNAALNILHQALEKHCSPTRKVPRGTREPGTSRRPETLLDNCLCYVLQTETWQAGWLKEEPPAFMRGSVRRQKKSITLTQRMQDDDIGESNVSCKSKASRMLEYFGDILKLCQKVLVSRQKSWYDCKREGS